MTDAMLLEKPARLAALPRLEVLDTDPEPAFENIVALVRTVLGVPIVTVMLVDEDRQWFKARAGMPHAETPRDVSFCVHTLCQRTPFVVPDAAADPRFAASPLVVGEPYVRSYAGVPLRTREGRNVGALCAIDTRPRVFTEGELAILTNFAGIVVSELELRRIVQRDQLTGVYSRRGFVERAEQEIERYRRYGRPGSMVLLDLDHFKRVNDGHGHPAGDAVLRGVVTILMAAMRPNDLVGRLGGEEFGILLPETGTVAALQAAERIRQAIARVPVAIGQGAPLRVTASFGIAALDPATASADAWIARADVPLYESKRLGRNRCTVAIG